MVLEPSGKVKGMKSPNISNYLFLNPCSVFIWRTLVPPKLAPPCSGKFVLISEKWLIIIYHSDYEHYELQWIT